MTLNVFITSLEKAGVVKVERKEEKVSLSNESSREIWCVNCNIEPVADHLDRHCDACFNKPFYEDED